MNMVERVARAIAEVAFAETHEGDAASEWDRVVPLARAAIQAMREPTELMKASAEHTNLEFCWGGEDSFYYISTEVAGEVFETMIDAALSETSEDKS